MKEGDVAKRWDISFDPMLHCGLAAYLVRPLDTIFLIRSRPAYSMYANQVARSAGYFAVARLRMYMTRRGMEKLEALGGGGSLS